MAKKAVKKGAVKKKSVVKKAKSAKTPTKTKKSTAKAGKASSLKAKLPKKKKKAVTPTKAKTVTKKSEKEIEFRQANVIANSEKKKRKPLTKLKGKTKSERPERALTLEEASALTKAVVEGMRERKAKNIAILDLKNIDNRVCDNFVICDADSKTHVMSIAESVEEMVYKLTGEKAYKSEGQENSEWILVDYVNVVAHIFLRETREHYNIEGLWGDAKFTLINN